jgi:uncharacterized DUF497 family protein
MYPQIEFEWDEAKAASNLAKHGVAFEYAAFVFQDPMVMVADASNPFDGEPRFKATGTIEGRIFTVVFTDRLGRRRLISARRSNAKETRLYGGALPL